VLNPLSCIIAYTLGTLLQTFGLFWDNSLGLLFTLAAKGVTLGSNWLDNQAGWCKQMYLSQIEILRATIYHWAFDEEDLLLHSSNEDKHYYQEQPERLEKIIPPTSGHNLLHTLLATKDQTVTVRTAHTNPSHFRLFTEYEIDADAVEDLGHGESYLTDI
jgi:hypothetical protein